MRPVAFPATHVGSKLHTALLYTTATGLLSETKHAKPKGTIGCIMASEPDMVKGMLAADKTVVKQYRSVREATMP